MDYQKIKFSVDNQIARIVLNNPTKLNPFDVPTYTEVGQALEECNRNDDVRVIVLSGEGKAFSAGGDINNMVSGGFEQFPKVVEDQLDAARKVAFEIRMSEKPVIASLKGVVAGSGFNIPLLCDFRVAADNCRFVQAFINIGLIPDLGGTFILTRIIGLAKATELQMLGEIINAQEAMSLGLLTKVVPLDELETETQKLAEKLTRMPSEAIGIIKRLYNQYEFGRFEEYMEKEREYQIYCSKSYDAKEGITAFLEKRKPNFK